MPYVLPGDTATRTLGQYRGATSRWVWPAPRPAPRALMRYGSVAAPPRRYLRGDYINQRFVLPTNSLGPAATLSGEMVESIYTRPPYRGLGQSWFDQEMISGVPNKYLALGGGLALLLLTGGRRRR